MNVQEALATRICAGLNCPRDAAPLSELCEACERKGAAAHPVEQPGRRELRPGEKRCTKCARPKLLDEFRLRPGRHTRASHCKACETEDWRQRRRRAPCVST